MAVYRPALLCDSGYLEISSASYCLAFGFLQTCVMFSTVLYVLYVLSVLSVFYVLPILYVLRPQRPLSYAGEGTGAPWSYPGGRMQSGVVRVSGLR